MDDNTARDLRRLFEAIGKVRLAAVAESAAVRAMLAAPSEQAMLAVHATHQAELDDVQVMGAALELFERRNPALMAKVASTTG